MKAMVESLPAQYTSLKTPNSKAQAGCLPCSQARDTPPAPRDNGPAFRFQDDLHVPR